MLRRLLPLFRARRTPILPTASNRVLLLPRHYRTSPPRLADDTPPPNASVSQRLKHLIKSYGWYALGVYMVFSALDFTVAFVGINLLGAEQVSHAATYVKQLLFGLLRNKPPQPDGSDTETEAASGDSHDGLYAMLVLAYTVHKTLFLPVRVGLTAALTPRIVGWLRARGWAGGQGAVRAAKQMRERIRITKDRE